MTLLSVRDLTAFYGPSQALFGVDLTVAQGEAVALMGRNGMGKTSTIRAICRMLVAQGRMEFAGRDLLALPSHRVARLGIGLVPEGRRCFRDLTVAENLLAAARPGAWDMTRVTTLFPRLRERQTQRAASLSGGEQQMLAIGRALMTNPRLLVLDEATEGLAPLVRLEIWDAIDRVRHETEMSILAVDKSVAELAKIASRAVILERGATVWTGDMSRLTPDVIERHIGI
ncbi:MAG: ABC transporter ATP-binding protein [Pseudomonadota bacterium]